MIFEINYTELAKPLMMIKELLTDKEYKGDVKQVTLETLSDSAWLYFEDERLGIQIQAELKGAEVQLPGTFTASFASFFENVKVFKKSEEPILFEREDEWLRIDDGIYPEELLRLKEESARGVLPREDEGKLILRTTDVVLKEGLQLASGILKKSDIPQHELDTQAVYLTTADGFVSFRSFSLYNYHHSKRKAEVHQPEVVQFPKTKASAVLKMMNAEKQAGIKWALYSVDGESVSTPGILLHDEENHITVFMKMEISKEKEALQKMFAQIEANFLNEMESAEKQPAANMSTLEKVKANDNAFLNEGKWEVGYSGYPAQLVKKFIETNPLGQEGVLFYSGNEEAPALCLFSENEDEQKMTTLSYRRVVSA